MQYVPPINGNQADPNRPYINANPSTSTEGSIPPAEAIEHPLREIVAAITLAGLTPNSGDLTQLGQAIQALATGGDMYKAQNLSGLADYAAARANMGILQRKGTTIASAATTNIGAADSHFISISGNNIITSLGTGTDRDVVMVEFTGTPTLTHHATNLPLPGNANIVVEAGDKGLFARRGTAGAAQWDLIGYLRKSGKPLVAPAGTIIAQASGTYSTYLSFTTPTIPFDDTIPQITEGIEIISISVTPEKAGDIIDVEWSIPLGYGPPGSYNVCAAIFVNGGANAVDATIVASNGIVQSAAGNIRITAVNGSVHTIALRIGINASTGQINGNSGRIYGGAAICKLSAKVIKS